MSETKFNTASRTSGRRQRQDGVFAVEFALIALLLFTVLFFVIELARALYIWNTLQEVTRRAAYAAAGTDLSDESAKSLVRQYAIFRTSAGTLNWGMPITDQYVRIDYLSLDKSSDGTQTLTPIPTGSLPACPARNRINCEADPNGSNCVRFVRVRLCAPGTGDGVCDPVPYQAMIPLIVFSVNLPVSTTIAKAGTLGYQSGSPMCP